MLYYGCFLIIVKFFQDVFGFRLFFCDMMIFGVKIVYYFVFLMGMFISRDVVLLIKEGFEIFCFVIDS